MKAVFISICLITTGHIAIGQTFMQRGVSAFNNRSYKEAVTWFNWAIKADTTDVERYLNRAHTKRIMGDNSGAKSDFEKVLELQPTNGDAHFWLALSAFNTGDYTSSIVNNELAIKYGSVHSSQAYLNRAQTYIRLGKNKKALEDYATVIKLKDKNLMAAHLDRGQLYRRMNDQKLALIDFKKVVELNPSNIQLSWDIGRISYEIEEYADALTYYSRALKEVKNPEPQLYLIRGETFEKLKNYEAAIEDYTRVIEMQPSLATAHYSRGQAKARSGDKKGACVDWKRAAELGHEEAKGVIVYNCKE